MGANASSDKRGARAGGGTGAPNGANRGRGGSSAANTGEQSSTNNSSNNASSSNRNNSTGNNSSNYPAQMRANAPNSGAASSQNSAQNRNAGGQQRPSYLMQGSGNAPVQYRHTSNGPMIFYVDRQQAHVQPPEVQESVKIKNHANLLKHTLQLVPISSSPSSTQYRIMFHCDTLVETTVRIWYAATEKLDAAYVAEGGCIVIPSNKSLPFCVHPPTRIRAETDQPFTSSASFPYDVQAYSSYMKYRSASNAVFFPMVIALSYEARSSLAGDNSSSSNSKEGGDSTVSKVQCQFTYIEVIKEDSRYSLRCVKQRLQTGDGSVFDLEDIFGVEGATSPGVVDVEGKDFVVDSVADYNVDGDECVICLTNERDTTVMPCRHMCLCGGCAEVLRKQTNKCPICRTVIEQLMTYKKEKL